MTCEQAFFLKVLSDHITKKKTEQIPNMDWDVLVKWAKLHKVEGILYYQCKDFLPPSFLDIMEKHYNAAIFLYKNRERILHTIHEAFTFYNIPYLTIKGMEIAMCYPIHELRTMGDSDILVHKEDKEKAGNILEELGFRIDERNPDYDWQCKKNEMVFELHHNLLYQEVITIDKQAQFFNNYWEYVNNDRLDWSFQYIYLIAHLRKHIMYSGAGFRMFMDLAVVSQAIPYLNWRWIENNLANMGLLRFAQVCSALIEQWFGIQIPIKYSQVSPSFIESATDKVFLNGVFGYDNVKNKNNSTINRLTRNGKLTWTSRILTFVKSLFPSYNNMVNSPFYHFIIGKAWLLPVAWLYRIYRLFMGRTLSIRDIMKGVMLSEDIVDERVIELKEWGLI